MFDTTLKSLEEKLNVAESELNKAKMRGDNKTSIDLRDRKCRILERLLLKIRPRNRELF